MSEERTTDLLTDVDYQTVEGLQQHPLFKDLTEKRRKFVLNFIAFDGDKVKASRHAFNCKSEEVAETLAYRTIRDAAIRTLIGLYYGYEMQPAPVTRSEFLSLVSTRLRKNDCPDATFAIMARMVTDLNGWKPRVGKPPSEERDAAKKKSKLGNPLYAPKQVVSPDAVEKVDGMNVADLVQKMEQEKGNKHENDEAHPERN